MRATTDARRTLIDFSVVALTLAAFMLRAWHLGGPSLGYDEAFDVAAAQRGLSALLELLAGREPYPPLHFLSLRCWLLLAGDSDFGLRYWSLLFGVALVPLVYQLGRQTLGSWVGLAAAGVATLNPALLWYSQEIKMYPAVMALATASTVCAARLLVGPPKASRGWSWGYVAATVAALYMHYPALFVLAFQDLFALGLLIRAGWSRVRQWALLQALVGLAFLPWMGLAFGLLRGYGSVAPAPADLLHLPRRFFEVFTFGYSDEIVAAGNPTWTAGVALLLVAAAAWIALRRRDGGGLYALGALVVPLALVCAIALWRPVFAARHLAVMAPAYCLVLGAGIVALARLRPRSATVVGLAVAAVLVLPSSVEALVEYYSSPVAERTDNRGVAGLIRAQWQEGDLIVFDAWYFSPAVTHYLGEGYPLAGLPADGETEAQTARRLADLTAQYQRVWLVLWQDDTADPNKTVERWLDRHLDRARDWHPASLTLILFASDEVGGAPVGGTPLASGQPLARFAGGPTLERYRVVDAPGEISVDLTWTAARPVDRSLTVFVHLLDEAGNRVAQHDGVPRDGRAPTSDWQPGEAIQDSHRLRRPAAGRYRLLIGLYDAATGQRAPLLGADGRAGADALTVTPVVLP